MHTARRIFRQVVQGLLYLHSYKILHRDLSLSNLLLTGTMDAVCTLLFCMYRLNGYDTLKRSVPVGGAVMHFVKSLWQQ